MSFVLKTVMDAIATKLVSDGVTTRAVGYPIDLTTPPQATVGYPIEFKYDYTAHAQGTTGKIRAVLPVRFIVGKTHDLMTRNGISDIVTGSPGVPESLGGSVAGVYLAGAVDTCNVSDAPRFEVENIAGTDYQVVVFDVEVIG